MEDLVGYSNSMGTAEVNIPEKVCYQIEGSASIY